MHDLFGALTRAVEGAPALAVMAALAWGVLSVLLSPCHLASIPLIVGFIDKQGRTSPARAFWISLLFAVGILITIGLIGVVTAAAGRIAGDVGRWGNYLVALVFFVVGLHLLGVIPAPWSGPASMPIERKGLLAALALGLTFGIALGPCTFAFMAPMLGVAFKAGAADLLRGASLLVAYGIGHCAVIVVAGTSVGLAQRYVDWNAHSKGLPAVRAVCGALVLLGGVWLIYTAP